MTFIRDRWEQLLLPPDYNNSHFWRQSGVHINYGRTTTGDDDVEHYEDGTSFLSHSFPSYAHSSALKYRSNNNKTSRPKFVVRFQNSHSNASTTLGSFEESSSPTVTMALLSPDGTKPRPPHRLADQHAPLSSSTKRWETFQKYRSKFFTPKSIFSKVPYQRVIEDEEGGHEEMRVNDGPAGESCEICRRHGMHRQVAVGPLRKEEEECELCEGTERLHDSLTLTKETLKDLKPVTQRAYKRLSQDLTATLDSIREIIDDVRARMISNKQNSDDSWVHEIQDEQQQPSSRVTHRTPRSLSEGSSPPSLPETHIRSHNRNGALKSPRKILKNSLQQDNNLSIAEAVLEDGDVKNETEKNQAEPDNDGTVTHEIRSPAETPSKAIPPKVGPKESLTTPTASESKVSVDSPQVIQPPPIPDRRPPSGRRGAKSNPRGKERGKEQMVLTAFQSSGGAKPDSRNNSLKRSSAVKAEATTSECNPNKKGEDEGAKDSNKDTVEDGSGSNNNDVEETKASSSRSSSLKRSGSSKKKGRRTGSRRRSKSVNDVNALTHQSPDSDDDHEHGGNEGQPDDNDDNELSKSSPNVANQNSSSSEYTLRHPKRGLGTRSLSSETAPEEKAGEIHF